MQRVTLFSQASRTSVADAIILRHSARILNRYTGTGVSLGLDGCEVCLCVPCARVRPRVPCVSRVCPGSPRCLFTRGTRKPKPVLYEYSTGYRYSTVGIPTRYRYSTVACNKRRDAHVLEDVHLGPSRCAAPELENLARRRSCRGPLGFRKPCAMSSSCPTALSALRVKEAAVMEAAVSRARSSASRIGS